jgi:hypothetical protein
LDLEIYSIDKQYEGKMPPNMIGDIGYVFRKKFGAQGWFMGTVVKIMKDGDPRCKYPDGCQGPSVG